ncbi:late embryogenesis abundant domain-containing protein / LEA domain-containing protein [Melia azedarach]|uniref:Late embryogenesis abundant domain-containing protein / LEA domain-containing protein n=1 Tax=Melia azedarach TaxID=155640 RepID=A0ACC1WQF8_MELAZ|nr:late embryogenesis abundant domain-containing protein / LEA domain-containing protein [Melia azedarach]
MMNLVAICLVVGSLAAGGVWSPSATDQKIKPQKSQNEDVVIVKEGHRMVVVEFDEEGKHNTKVSISPEHEYQFPKPKPASDVEEKISAAAEDVLSNVKDKIKEASSVLPDLKTTVHGPGELICDAYGKCKHKIAIAIEKAKDKVSGAARETAAKQKEMAHEAKETVQDVIAKKEEVDNEGRDVLQDAYGKAKESASEKASGAKKAAKDALGKAKETASEKAYEAKEAVKDALGKAKETASEKAYEMKEGAKEAIKDVMDVGKTIREDVVRNVTEEVENVGESVVEKVKEAKEGIEHAAKSFATSLSTKRLSGTVNAMTGVLNLLGVSTAYGMSIWVTFISSYVLSFCLPRQQFGMVQSKIYAVYFRAMACSIGLALLGHMPQLFSNNAGKFQGYNLLASILMVLANSMYLEPRATKVMFERMKVEKEEGRGRESPTGETSSMATEQRAATTTTHEAETSREQEAAIRTKMGRLSERLRKLNTWSSVLNVATLMSLTWHLVYLGQRLHTTV